MSDRSVKLLVRAGCCLCDEAHDLLVEHRLRPELVDVDGDPLLVEQYGNCVPVVVIDGRVRFRGKVNPVLLKRLVRTRSAEQGMGA